MTAQLAVVEESQPIKLDIGCGKNKREGFIGLDIRAFDGVDLIADLSQSRWKVSAKEGKPSAVCAAVQEYDYLGVPAVNGEFDYATFKDNSVTEAHCSHFVEHLTGPQRIAFVNELHRVLVSGGKATIIVPHWSSCRAYGDLTHQWPPVSEFWFYYLSKAWRETNAPHNDGYTCDFDATWGYSLHQSLMTRNQEYQMHAMTFWKEAAQDIIATLVKK